MDPESDSSARLLILCKIGKLLYVNKQVDVQSIQKARTIRVIDVCRWCCFSNLPYLANIAIQRWRNFRHSNFSNVTAELLFFTLVIISTVEHTCSNPKRIADPLNPIISLQSVINPLFSATCIQRGYQWTLREWLTISSVYALGQFADVQLIIFCSHYWLVITWSHSSSGISKLLLLLCSTWEFSVQPTFMPLAILDTRREGGRLVNYHNFRNKSP